MKAPAHLKQHANFDAGDYEYLASTGWPDEKILSLWDQEVKIGRGPCRQNNEKTVETQEIKTPEDVLMLAALAMSEGHAQALQELIDQVMSWGERHPRLLAALQEMHDAAEKLNQ